MSIILRITGLTRRQKTGVRFRVINSRGACARRFVPFPTGIAGRKRGSRSDTVTFVRGTSTFLFPDEARNFPCIILRTVVARATVITSSINTVHRVMSNANTCITSSFGTRRCLGTLITFYSGRAHRRTTRRNHAGCLSRCAPTTMAAVVLSTCRGLVEK